MQTWWDFLEDQGIVQDVVIGVDEAGRGPLAGPVCVAGVVLPKDHGIQGLNDSKLLKVGDRERLFDEIVATGQVFVELASNRIIDRDGILVVTKRLMRKVVKDSGAQMALLDAVTVNLRDVYQIGLTKGDSRVDCIAAASIIAKVTRDRLMQKMDQQYPGYGLAKHKGYGTKQHRDALAELGMSQVHRKSFCSGF